MTHIIEYLDTNGDGTGTVSATGDYLATADDFYYQATEACEIHRLVVTIQDAGIMTAAAYGFNIALTNGIRIFQSLAGVEFKLDGGIGIKTNADWGSIAYDVDVKEWGAGNQILVSRLTFAKMGKPIILNANDRFIVRLNRCCPTLG